MKTRFTIVLGVLVVAACGQPFEPTLAPNPEGPDEASLTDFRRGPLQEPAAFDLITVVVVRTDQASGWDFVFEIDDQGTPSLRPRGEVLDKESDAGLLHTSSTFEGLSEAPADGYIFDAPVPIEEGDVLAAVSRRDPVFGSVRCRYYGKLEILSIDLQGLALTFRHLVNPNCEKRDLQPGET